MPDEITITIDGKQVKTKPGKMVLEAAIDSGVYVPYLCYHPGMKPFGACRMCVVEIEGQRGAPASCTVPVADGMVVKTTTDTADQIRKSVMDTLIAEHPHGCLTCHRISLCGPEDVCLRHVAVTDRCVVCPKNERCEFKDTVRYMNMDLQSSLSYGYRHERIEVGDPFWDRDMNLCIVCGRCVRACEELRGDNAINFTDRSGRILIGTSFGSSLLESGCEFCGACIDVCPVGALTEKAYKWDKAREVTTTVCLDCPVGCGVHYEVSRGGRVIRAIGDLYNPASRGQLCYKGKFGYQYTNSRARLRTPMVRRDGKLVETSWAEAVRHAAERLKQVQGGGSALIVGPRCTNEDAYAAAKFARVAMKTNNVVSGAYTRPGLFEGLRDTIGVPAQTNPTWDLEQAACVLLVNTNLTEEQTVVGVPLKRAARQRGQALIVVDPREVEMTRYTKRWLRARPGTEPLLMAALLKAVVGGNLVNAEYVNANIEGLDALRASLNGINLDDVAKRSGVSRQAIEDAARAYAKGPSAIVYAFDNIPASQHRACAHVLANLALVTGNLGKPGTGLYPMRHGGNEQGACDVGCIPSALPGYRAPDDREFAEEEWHTSGVAGPGMGLREIVEAARGGKLGAAVLVGGESPFLHNGEAGDALAALSSVPFLVVQDRFLSPLAQAAEVVLPLTSAMEQAGTATNLERRIQLVQPALRSRTGEARPAWWMLGQLAQAMNVHGFEFAGPEEIAAEIARVVPQYRGVTHARLIEVATPIEKPADDNPLPNQVLLAKKAHPGIVWPVADDNPTGTQRLFANGFTHGKAKLQPVAVEAFKVDGGQSLPLVLTPGRVLFEEDNLTSTEITKREGKLNVMRRTERVVINRADAQRLDVKEGDAVAVETVQGSIEGVARLDGAAEGTVSVTTLFGGLALQLARSEDPDPMAHVPQLVVAPARVVKK